MSAPSNDIRSRGDTFAPHLETRITEEIPHATNPYLAEEVRFHGYDHLELMAKLPFTDVLFLLLRGELPTPEQADVFRRLSVALINPGIRHPAGQAAIVAGVGKTNPTLLLPIALSVYGGEHDGSGQVEAAMRYYRKASRTEPQTVAKQHTTTPIPGFGAIYGDPDPYAARLLAEFPMSLGPVITWVQQLHEQALQQGFGILRAGVCAAVLLELGFLPRQGTALMQCFAVPGLMAHGLEFANKPLTHMLFEPDENYDIEEPL